MNEEDTPKKPTVHDIGESLDSLSIEELEERVELLQSEIARLVDAIAAKRASADIADSFFKT